MVRRAVFLLILPLAGWAAGPTVAETARAVRAAGLDLDQCYRVRDLSLYKDDIKLYFNDGFLIFSKPVTESASPQSSPRTSRQETARFFCCRRSAANGNRLRGSPDPQISTNTSAGRC